MIVFSKFSIKLKLTIIIMLTDNSSDIFYQVKKEILDKLDLILQKVNLEIINSTPPKSNIAQADFTFIELSQFQTQISSLFLYLDKLYDSLNSSISGYASPSVNHTSSSQLQALLEQERNTLKQQNERLQQQLVEANRQATERAHSVKRVRDKLIQIQTQVRLEPQQVSMFKKWIGSRLKQFKFEMLETRVEILSRIADVQAYHKQVESARLREQANKDKQKAIEKQSKQVDQITCHHISHDEMQIINQLNEILRMC